MTEQHQDVQAELNDQLLVRREKMAQMAEAGVNPFAAGFSRDHLSAQILHDYNPLSYRPSRERVYCIIKYYRAKDRLALIAVYFIHKHLASSRLKTKILVD